VQLKLDGAQGELDRNVLERMTAPLEHMLRNAVAHGLESPERSQEGTRSPKKARSASRCAAKGRKSCWKSATTARA
jgi:chemosensory pili system protein ChpA (sensor histidine kinase/response regulator)